MTRIREALQDALHHDDIPSVLLKDLEINLDNLDAEMARQPIRFAHWGVAAANAADEVERAKTRLARVRSAAWSRHSEPSVDVTDDTAVKTKKPTEKAIEAAVDADPAVITCTDQYNAALLKKRVYERVERAFEQRHTALNSLCATERKLVGDS